MLVRSHAFAIVDGVVYGNYSDATKLKTRVESAYRIEQPVETQKVEQKYVEGTKICTCCGKALPLESFHNNKRSKDGRGSKCKKCYNVWNNKENQARRAAIRTAKLNL